MRLRVTSYAICTAIIIVVVLSQWYELAVVVPLNSQNAAGIGIDAGDAAVVLFSTSGKHVVSDEWLGVHFESAPRRPYDRSWVPVIRSYGHPQLNESITALMVADFYPFMLALIGITLTFLAGRRARRRNIPGHCQCGYDLRGNPAAVTCPECGAATDRATEPDT